MKKPRRAGKEELHITAGAFINEIRQHLKAGNTEMAQAMISGASMGLALAEDADGDLREAFGAALSELVGWTLDLSALDAAGEE